MIYSLFYLIRHFLDKSNKCKNAYKLLLIKIRNKKCKINKSIVINKQKISISVRSTFRNMYISGRFSVHILILVLKNGFIRYFFFSCYSHLYFNSIKNTLKKYSTLFDNLTYVKKVNLEECSQIYKGKQNNALLIEFICQDIRVKKYQINKRDLPQSRIIYRVRWAHSQVGW